MLAAASTRGPLMRVAVLGSGLSGLTAAALLARRGHRVSVYEQHPEIGGVTSSIEKGGFRWDLGQMLVPDLEPGEPGRSVLEELGISEQVEVVRGCRAMVFPDFAILRPEVCSGPYWRRDHLGGIFPEEADGLDRYYQLYDQVHDLLGLRNQPGLGARIRLLLGMLRIRRIKGWTAEQLLDACFSSPRLKAVFSHILADYSTQPRDFPGLIIPIINPEAAYDERVPLQYGGHERRSSWTFIRGGTRALVDAIAGALIRHGGEIHPGTEVTRILVRDRRVLAVELGGARREPVDAVVASGGARELFTGLIGREHLPSRFLSEHVENLAVTSSVFMVHLGVDFDPSVHQNGQALCYYYSTYEVEPSIRELEAGVYHEGRDGFVVYVPSKHSPEMARPGHHAVTLYTVAPDTLASGTWAERGEELGDRLICYAERYLPGLAEHTVTKVLYTPEDFRRRSGLAAHAFGGCPPRVDRTPPRHRTPIRGLWFVGAQSEVYGGVTGAMTGSRRAVDMMTRRGRF
jgi:phytoene dehydrogenase-like protein